MTEKTEYKPCPECGGSGELEERIDCGMPMSMCCGGCLKDVTCWKCKGEGEIEVE